MKVACALISHFRVKAELKREPHLEGLPVIIVDRDHTRPLAIDSSIGSSVMVPGTTLEQALALRPDAVVVEADEPHYRRVFRQVLNSLLGVSDRVEDSDLGTAWVGIDGLEQMYGGEARLVATLLNVIPRWLNPRIGVGQGKFPALVAARSSGPLGATRVPADPAAFLAPHPVDLLPVSSGTRESLHRFGLHTLGQIAAMPCSMLVDRFGHEGWRAWSLSNGNDDTPLVPLRQEEAVVERTSLPFSSTSLELLLVAVDTLLRRAYARPEIRGRYAGKVNLECTVFRAAPWQKSIAFQEGVNRWERASFIVRSRLEAEPPEAPVDDLTLTLADFTGESGAQLGMLPELRETRQQQLVEVERRLQTRNSRNSRESGASTLYRVVNVAPWHPAPEMRAVQAPLDQAGTGGIRPLLAPVPVLVRENSDHQPAAVRQGSRWRRVDRIAERWSFDLWWLPKPLTRTYYRVDREDGRQVVLFRDQREDRWYQQGN
ncbi:MAG: hypothetical protein F4X65_04225 [Chloroflexi bacterium]|nr:hypothetical protein [Chloroflexota bacterium]